MVVAVEYQVAVGVVAVVLLWVAVVVPRGGISGFLVRAELKVVARSW